MFLQLFVKVSEKWREREEFLNQLDWRTALSASIETTDSPLAPPALAETTGSAEGGNEHNGK
jgi:hypothetical protein